VKVNLRETGVGPLVHVRVANVVVPVVVVERDVEWLSLFVDVVVVVVGVVADVEPVDYKECRV
jgi:hypothetical protein